MIYFELQGGKLYRNPIRKLLPCRSDRDWHHHLRRLHQGIVKNETQRRKYHLASLLKRQMLHPWKDGAFAALHFQGYEQICGFRKFGPMMPRIWRGVQRGQQAPWRGFPTGVRSPCWQEESKETGGFVAHDFRLTEESLVCYTFAPRWAGKVAVAWGPRAIGDCAGEGGAAE